nr:MAG TPA: radical SAM peptide maturase, CXXX-repeat target family [Caudoviricetes sp.]
MELKKREIQPDYSEFIRRLFADSNRLENYDVSRNVTFQITNQCNLRCSYCYEHNKSSSSMDIYTGKKCVDTLLNMYCSNDNEFINRNTKALVLDFIGGEPLLEAKLIEGICDYYFDECFRRNIPLAPFTRISFATNGQLWFSPEAQHLIEKYHEIMSVTVSIDGVQSLHDKYRIDQYGQGSFEKSYLAFLDGKKKYSWANSKMTFTPGSTKYLFDSVKMMIQNGCKEIHCNYAYEPMYTKNDATDIYLELMKLSDYLVENKSDVLVSILDEQLGGKVDLVNENKNYCGGTGNMLAFAPDGRAYPCIRYMPISIGEEKSSKICIGNCYEGIYKKDNEKAIKTDLDAITYTSQSPQKCIDCPVSQGCGWCSGYNFELYGTPNKRYTGICYAHKGRVLASCYYYLKRYLVIGDVPPKVINLPNDEVRDIVGEENAKALFDLQEQAARKILSVTRDGGDI